MQEDFQLVQRYLNIIEAGENSGFDTYDQDFSGNYSTR
jgi:hypothetical protein